MRPHPRPADPGQPLRSALVAHEKNRGRSPSAFSRIGRGSCLPSASTVRMASVTAPLSRGRNASRAVTIVRLSRYFCKPHIARLDCLAGHVGFEPANLCRWKCETTAPEVGATGRRRPFACELRDTDLQLRPTFQQTIFGAADTAAPRTASHEPSHVCFRFWLCENSSGRATRRNTSGQLHP